MSNFRFRRGERLKRKQTIDSLFAGANSLSQFPLLLLWKKTEDIRNEAPPFPVQFSSSVSKKKFKTAVDRNFIKRRIREAYRLKKQDLYQKLEGEEAQYAFMVIFTGRALEDCNRIERSMNKILDKFVEQVK